MLSRISILFSFLIHHSFFFFWNKRKAYLIRSCSSLCLYVMHLLSDSIVRDFDYVPPLHTNESPTDLTMKMLCSAAKIGSVNGKGGFK